MVLEAVTTRNRERRERIATAVLAALLSNRTNIKIDGKKVCTADEYVTLSVAFADGLSAELDKEEPHEQQDQPDAE